MARFTAHKQQNRKPQARGIFVNSEGVVSYGYQAAGDLPYSPDMSVEKADRFAAAMANMVVTTAAAHDDASIDVQLEVLDLIRS